VVFELDRYVRCDVGSANQSTGHPLHLGGLPMPETWRRREALDISTPTQRIVALPPWATSQDSVTSAAPLPAAGP